MQHTNLTNNQAERRQKGLARGLLLMTVVGVMALPLIPVVSAQANYTIDAGEDTMSTTDARVSIEVDGETVIAAFEGCAAGDTTVARLADVIGVPGENGIAVGATAVRVTDLCLHGTAPIDVDDDGTPEVNDPYVRLDPNDASVGTMVIEFNPDGLGGTFSSTIVVNYILYEGSGTDPDDIKAAGTTGPMPATNVPWARNNDIAVASFCHHGQLHRHCTLPVDPPSEEGEFVPGATPPSPPNTPTLSAWGIMGMMAAMAGIGVLAVSRRK